LTYTNINGKIIPSSEAAIPVDNGAFRYGYGLFETMLVQDGAIKLGQYHWERLFAGLKQLYFEITALMTAERLEQEVLKLVKKNKLEHLCRVRLQVYAGGGGLYGDGAQHAAYVIECFPLESDTLILNENGLVVGIAEGIRKSADGYSNLKSCNAMVYAIGARQAKANQWNDALICNNSGNIIESTIANIFWIKNEEIFTPSLEDGCVAGVMRRHVMDMMKEVTCTKLSKEILLQADEVFLTNAIKKVRWVGTFENRKYSNKMTTKINNLL